MKTKKKKKKIPSFDKLCPVVTVYPSVCIHFFFCQPSVKIPL